MDELAAKLRPEYIALIGELQDMDPDSEDGKEIASTLEALDKLWCKLRPPSGREDDHCSGNRQQSPKDFLSKADKIGSLFRADV